MAPGDGSAAYASPSSRPAPDRPRWLTAFEPLDRVDVTPARVAHSLLQLRVFAQALASVNEDFAVLYHQDPTSDAVQAHLSYAMSLRRFKVQEVLTDAALPAFWGLERIKVLLAAGMDPNIVMDGIGVPAFACAIADEDAEMLKVWLDLGVNLNGPAWVMEEHGADVNIGVMAYAALHPNPDVIRLLLRYGCSPNSALASPQRGIYQVGLLHLLVSTGDWYEVDTIASCIRELVVGGADVISRQERCEQPTTDGNFAGFLNGANRTPLQLVCHMIAKRKSESQQQRLLKFARVLLECGADVDATCDLDSYCGLRCLDIAIHVGAPNLQLFELPVEAGADIQPHEYALDAAGRRRIVYFWPLIEYRSSADIRLQILKRCLELGADPHYLMEDVPPEQRPSAYRHHYDRCGPFILEVAVFYRLKEAVKLLIAAGACVDSVCVGDDGRPTLRLLLTATRKKDAKMVKLLLDAKANPRLVDQDLIESGLDPQGLLHFARHHSTPEIVELLKLSGVPEHSAQAEPD